MKNDIEAALARRLAHLKVEGLSAGYGNFLVLRDLSLEARPGLTVILGPNGAGKTTLLKAIVGLIPRQGGCCWTTPRSHAMPRPARSCSAAWCWCPKVASSSRR